MKKYLDILGLQEGANQEEIKKKYKELALKCHPDRPGGNEEKFKSLTEAYEILIGKRKNPEQAPSLDFNFGFGSPLGFDFADFFFKGAPRTAQPRSATRPPERDSEVTLGLNLTIEDIKQGKDIEVKYQKSKKCDTCNGIGGKEKNKCAKCNGQGVIREVHTNGNFHQISSYSCPDCLGAGDIIKECCNTCHGNGFMVYLERLVFEVKEKK